MTTEIKLLGLVSVRHDDDEVTLTSPQAQVALARLALERHSGTTRHALADALWPDGLPATWSSAMRGVVSRVRSVLVGVLPPGPVPLVAEGGTYTLRLPDDVTVDLEAAAAGVAAAQDALTAGEPDEARRRACAATARLKWPFLPHHDGDWVRRVRDDVVHLTVTAYETASLATLDSDPTQALGFANHAVSVAPLRESAHRCRIRAHAAGGNRAEALRAYQRLRRLLAEELGVDPSDESEAVYLGLLGSARPSPPASRRVGLARPLPFIGRQGPMATVTEAWAVLGDPGGLSHLVLVAGEPGVGKTRLAAEAGARIAATGGMVLQGHARSSPTEPCGPLIEAFDGYLGATPADEHPVLGPATQRDLAAVMPSLRASSMTPSRVASPDRVALALTELALAAGRDRPLALVLDDLPRADRHTFRCLWQALTAPGTRLLVIATARHGDDRSEAYTAMVEGLIGESRLSHVALAGLSEADIHELVDLVSDEPRVRRRARARDLMADTAGNPFLLDALLLAPPAGGEGAGTAEAITPSVRAWVRARLSGLDGPSLELLQAAAVAGQGSEAEVVSRAAGLDAGAALRGLEQLMAHGLLDEVRPTPDHPTRLRFVHDVTRRGVLAGLSGIRRRQLHCAVADAIEGLPSSRVDRSLVRLAYHRAAGSDPPDDRAAASLRRAGRAGGDQSAHQSVRLLRQAFEYLPASDQEQRADTLTDLGLATVAVDAHEAAQALMQAVIEARGCRRADIAGRALVGLVDASRRSGTLQSEAASLVDWLQDWAAESSSPMADLDHARLLAYQVDRGGRVDGDRSGLLAAAARELAGELGRTGGFDRLEEREALAADLHLVAAAASDPDGLVVAAHHSAMVGGFSGDHAAIRRSLTTLATGAACDHPATAVMLAVYNLGLAVAAGRVTDAHAVAQLAGDLPPVHGPDVGALGLGHGVDCDLAVAAWLEAGALPPASVEPWPSATSLRRAWDSLARGDRGEAHVVVRALATGIEALPDGDAWPHAVGLLGMLAVELGDPTTATAVRAVLAPHAGLDCCFGYRGYLGPVELHLGRLAVVTGDWADAERQLSAALHRLATMRARPWMAIARRALADVLEGRGRLHDRGWVDQLRVEAARTAMPVTQGWPVATRRPIAARPPRRA